MERGVARVELWLRKESTVAFARVINSTQVMLENSYAEGFLVVGTKADGTRFQTGVDIENNFGRMLIPNGKYEFVGWFYESNDPLELDCLLYTSLLKCRRVRSEWLLSLAWR